MSAKDEEGARPFVERQAGATQESSREDRRFIQHVATHSFIHCEMLQFN
jgi:hypothetical protein